jgi:glycosidase
MLLRKPVGLGLCLALLGCVPSAMKSPRAMPDSSQAMPSPDWRDQVIYFAMIDRFADGDPGNNDQGAGEYDPTQAGYYSGGDLKGLEQRLDYIRELGATALWITPPVANQWWNPGHQHTGYHGYWARDFMAVDAHYGTLADYRSLARALHARQMALIQDIVVNHSGDYFSYDGPWNAADPARHFRRHADVDGALAPTQAPFDRNDASDPAQRAEAIYHYTPKVTDFADPEQEANYQMSGLDDLNTENPRVRQALRQSYGWWLREVGVDGFRVDTAFYVPPEFFEDFLYSTDPEFPGIDRVARASGRERFHVFGEGFALDGPGEDAAMRKIDRYMRAEDGQPRMPGMINFPLYGSLVDVYARGRPTADLAERIESMMRIHAQPHLLPSFIDNHDVDRFLAGGSEAGLRQALLAMLTLPGIPTLYYGTEQGFREPRAAMFAAGYGSGGQDHFDTQAPLFRYLQAAIALRREHRVLSRGTPEILHRNPAGAGALAWRMSHETEQAIVVFNSSEQAALLDHLDTGLPAGTRLQPLFAIAGTAPDLRVDTAGQVHLALPPRSGYVWRPGEVEPLAAPVPASAPVLNPPGLDLHHEDFLVSGSAAGAIQLVVDGELASAQRVEPDSAGRWLARIDTRAMLDPTVEHRLLAWDAARQRASASYRFRVQREWQLLADVADPSGDDHGPNGRYQYPDDPGWRLQRPADIERIRVYSSGGSLRVELTMHQVLSPWNPPNGFDHVAFTLFVELPQAGPGLRLMPLQQGELPGDMRWHYRLRAHGWSNTWFSAAGASAESEGSAVIPTATIATDAGRRSVSFTLPRAALGNPESLSGARLYLNTWDYDGGYRELGPTAGPHRFGGAPPDAPLVMDDSPVIELR